MCLDVRARKCQKILPIPSGGRGSRSVFTRVAHLLRGCVRTGPPIKPPKAKRRHETERTDLVKLRLTLLALAVAGIAPIALAQDDAETEKAIEKYRQMLKEDPWSNPGLLDADRGEALWTTPRGPKNVSLERCDLGKGPGKVDGAFAELPRYFADADRVMDVETRILWCMETLQGFNRADLITRPHPGG